VDGGARLANPGVERVPCYAREIVYTLIVATQDMTDGEWSVVRSRVPWDKPINHDVQRAACLREKELADERKILNDNEYEIHRQAEQMTVCLDLCLVRLIPLEVAHPLMLGDDISWEEDVAHRQQESETQASQRRGGIWHGAKSREEAKVSILYVSQNE
jgi:hypothetical protein